MLIVVNAKYTKATAIHFPLCSLRSLWLTILKTR